MIIWVFVLFFLLMILGVPVAYSLFGSSLIYLFAEGLSLSIAVQRVIAGVYSFPLLAVPFFILAGNLMNVGGITKKIFRFADVCVGHITGGLGHANVLASIIFAGMSGSAVADAGGLGSIEIRAMKEAGYDEDFSVAITAASSIIGPIIPPSIVAVVYSVFSGASIGRLLVAGILPGLLMGLVLSILVYIQCKKRNYPVRKRAGLKEFFTVFIDTFPALLTPIILIGGIVGGVFTPTEAAVVASLYALLLGLATKQLKVKDISPILVETLKVSVNIAFIIGCSALFGWVLTHASIAKTLVAVFQNTISSKIVAILVLNVIMLIIGTFLDNSAAIPIFAPVLVPIAANYGIDPVHFGIIMILNLVIGLLTPPIGMVLFTLSGVTKMPVMRIAKVTYPYIIALIIVLYLVAFVPQISLFLPNLFYGV